MKKPKPRQKLPFVIGTDVSVIEADMGGSTTLVGVQIKVIHNPPHGKKEETPLMAMNPDDALSLAETLRTQALLAKQTAEERRTGLH